MGGFQSASGATKLSKKAKSNLLKQEIDDIKPSRWLNDTRTAAVYIRNYLEKYVKFADIPNDLQDSQERESKQIRRIEVVNGRLTSMLRHYWGIGKKDRNNHLHHAQDAVAIAFCSSGIIQNFAKFLQIEEDKSQKKLNSDEINEIIKQNKKGRWVFKRPFSGFAIDLAKRIYGDENSEGIFVTFDKKHRTKGKLHNDNPINIKSGVEEALKQNKDTTKYLKKEDIKKLKKRLANAQSEILARVEQEKAKLGRMLSGEEYGKIKSKIEHPIKKQFYEEVTKDRKNKDNVWIEVNGHIYEMGNTSRIDIFYSNGKYYAVPIYFTTKELLPVPNSLNDKDFLFSLYNGDLVEFIYSDGVARYGYYRGFRQRDGELKIKHHSGYLSKIEIEENFWKEAESGIGKERRLCIKSFKSLKLCHINALGDRKTLKALDINKGERKRGKAPSSKTMGARKAKK